MKKTLLILLCLIGLSTLNRVSAQSDLDIVNTTGCGFTVLGYDVNSATCASSSATTSVAAGASFTLTFTGGPFVVYKAIVTDCASNVVHVYKSVAPCASGRGLTAILPSSACCPSPVTVTFTPATSTNAVLTFN